MSTKIPRMLSNHSESSKRNKVSSHNRFEEKQRASLEKAVSQTKTQRSAIYWWPLDLFICDFGEKIHYMAIHSHM